MIMKKIILSSVLMTCLMATNAQPPSPVSVVPGSKSQLPTLATPPDFTEPNRFGALNGGGTLNSDQWASDRGKYHVGLSWAEPERFGGESYTLQYRYGSLGEWQTEKDDDNKIMYFGKESLGYSFRIYSLGATIYFRLQMHGGEKDGFLSNEISVHTPTMFTAYAGYGSGNENMFNLVGVPIVTEYNLMVRAWDPKLEKYIQYTSEDSVYIYKWFRKNPKTYDITYIEGANERTYTPTIEDVGYWLYCEISGDEEHCSFTTSYLPCSMNPMVCVPVLASPAYYGEEGFVLNTDYVVPEPEKNLGMSCWDWNEETQTGKDMFNIFGNKLSERKPGQYAVKMPMEEYAYNNVMLSEKMQERGYVLTFGYEHGPYSEDILWYREAQFMPDRYMGGLEVTTTLGGKPVAANVDIIGPDIDGKMVVKATATTDEETGLASFGENIYTLGDGYYVKARATDGTQDIYYPSVFSMADARLVKPLLDEYWNPTAITIEMNGGGGKKGDVNGDNSIDVADIATVIDAMASGSANASAADVNGDGQVDVADIACIIDMMAEK